jgi:hypothetical protein
MSEKKTFQRRKPQAQEKYVYAEGDEYEEDNAPGTRGPIYKEGNPYE